MNLLEGRVQLNQKYISRIVQKAKGLGFSIIDGALIATRPYLNKTSEKGGYTTIVSTNALTSSFLLNEQIV